MSKFVKYQTEVLKDVDRDLFCKTLEEIGYGYESDNASVNNSYGREKTDIVLKNRDGRELDLGITFLKDENGKLNAEISGDFWNTGTSQKEFTNLLSQYYQKNRIIDNLENSGFMISETELNSEQEIVIGATMYA